MGQRKSGRTVNFIESLDAGVSQGVGRVRSRVGVCPDTCCAVGNILTHDVVSDGGTLLLCPLGHCVRPTLTHTASLGGLETATSSTTGHAVGDAVRHLMHGDVILESTVPSDL